jgi:hypothetical protein
MTETLSLTQNEGGRFTHVEAKLVRGQAAPEYSLTADQVNLLFAQHDIQQGKVPQGSFAFATAMQLLKMFYVTLGKQKGQFALPPHLRAKPTAPPLPGVPRLVGNIMVGPTYA